MRTTIKWMACFAICTAFGIGLHEFGQWVFDQGKMSMSSANHVGDVSAFFVAVGAVGFCTTPLFVWCQRHNNEEGPRP